MNKHRLFWITTILALTLTLFPAAAQDTPPATQGGWTQGAPMPTRRSELASALLDGNIYVAGGIGENWTTRTEVERYSIAANTWKTVAPLPIGLNHLGMAALDGHLYVTGGYTDVNFTVDQTATYAYDPSANAWTRLADMPAPRAAHAMVAADGKLYVIGGVGPRATETWSYDPAADSWDASLPAMPIPREHLASVSFGELFYGIGGRADGNNLGTFSQYEIPFSRWSEPLPNLPTPRGGLTAAAIDGIIHVTGGEAFDPSATFAQHEVFKYGEWTTAEPLPIARHGLTSAAYQGRWYVIGGAAEASDRTAATVTDRVDIYTVRAAYPQATETGIASVDELIKARLTNDIDALKNQVQYLTLNCIVKGEGLGSPPLCADGEAAGTPVEVLPMLSGEGTFVRRADIDSQLQAAHYSLLTVYKVADDQSNDPNFPSGDYGVVFVNEDQPFFNALNYRVSDKGIVRIDTGAWPDMVTGYGVGDFILPPLVPLSPA
ncbi:MAG: kelch repeat-containing protein [Chloroflexota bacterium]